MEQINYKYHKGSHAPDWFKQTNPHHYAITSGTSPFNEYYGFNNDDDVYKLAHSFTSQSFIDQFVYIEDKKAWHHFEDLTLADARSMLEAESRF